MVGGNAAGIFIHSVQPDSLAYHAGLRTGDQILEYNGTDLRSATAEEAAYELAKPADKVTVLAHYRIDSKFIDLQLNISNYRKCITKRPILWRRCEVVANDLTYVLLLEDSFFANLGFLMQYEYDWFI